MFMGNAEEAMNYYLSIFERSAILSIQRYGAGESGTEGTVMHATFSLNGQQFMCIDSNVTHAFTFTPATSFYVTCSSEAEVDRVYEKLSEGGAVLMPLAAYPFSSRYAWVQDKFGVSWQIGLALS